MDPFHLCLALGPVAIYLLLLGLLNLARRPFLVSGTRDAAALGLALSGFVVVGPLALLFPDVTAAHLGSHGVQWVWVMLVGSYGACLVALLLSLQPRLVIYNISADQLRPILAELVERLDPDARWAGDSLVLPGIGVQLHLDALTWMRNVALVSAGSNQDHQGWRRLEGELATALRRVEVPRNPRGMTLFSIGVCTLGALVYAIARDPQTVAYGLSEVLNAMLDMLRP